MSSVSETPAIGSRPISADERRSWEEEFEAAARRPLATRIRYGFVHTYKPVLDDEPYRSFDSMSEYRHWCETHLPSWLGYARVRVPTG